MIVKPDLKTFLKRATIGALIMAAVLLPLLTAIDFWGGLIVTAFSPGVYLLVFDDYRAWRRTRDQTWGITADGLSLTDGGAPYVVTWDTVETSWVHWWDGVVIKLSDSQRIKMNFLADPEAVNAAIKKANTP